MNAITWYDSQLQATDADEILKERLRPVNAADVQLNDEIYTYIGDTLARGRVRKIRRDGPDRIVFHVIKDKNTYADVKYWANSPVQVFQKNKISMLRLETDYDYESVVRKFLFTYPNKEFSIKEVTLNVRNKLPDGMATPERTGRVLRKLYAQGDAGRRSLGGTTNPSVYFAKGDFEIGNVVWHNKLKENEKVGIITALNWHPTFGRMIPTVRWTTGEVFSTDNLQYVTDPAIIEDTLDWKRYFIDQEKPEGLIWVPLELRRAIYRSKKNVDATGKPRGHSKLFDNQVLIEIGLIVGILTKGDAKQYRVGIFTNNKSTLVFEPYRQRILDYLDKYYPTWRKMNRKPRVNKR